jgi:hypothetical protein
LLLLTRMFVGAPPALEAQAFVKSTLKGLQVRED